MIKHGRVPKEQIIDAQMKELRAIKEELRQRMHESIVQQGQWLRQVVRGYFAYHAVPTNIRRLVAFRYFVGRLWLKALRRRSQKDRFSWERLTHLTAEWLPLPRILHPWPDARFAVNHPR